MSYDYGYGVLENKLIELFQSGAPDFEAAEDLIRQGADVNAVGKDEDENILSEILSNYWWTEQTDIACEDCEKSNCGGCELNKNPRLGESMCQIIRFFLDHGFDVNKHNGCYGAQCLWALTLATYNRYMIEATKILLDAGAVNRTVEERSTDQEDTPRSFVAIEGSFQRAEENHAVANIYEATYQIYRAIEDGRPYSGIDSYELAVGKKIQKVLAERCGEGPVFYSMDLPMFKKENCFNQRLYFVYDGGVLIVTQYADFWTDTVLPDAELIDVSEHFEGIVGSTIERFVFDHRNVAEGRTFYGQPIIMIEMDSGHKVKFSINFGEVKREDCAAYYELV